MTIKKKLILITSFILILCFLCILRTIYISNKYHKEYLARRNMSASYQELADNGTLDHVKNYVLNHLDDLFTPHGLEDKQVKINLTDIKDIEGINSLLKEGFQYIRVTRNSEKIISIKLKKLYMTYNRTPTYHLILYFSDEFPPKSEDYKKIDELQHWYFWSYDNNEHGHDNFLEIKWLVRYKEANSFFRRKKLQL